MSFELEFPILLVSPASGSATRAASGSAPKQSYRYLTNAFYECQPPNVAKISDLKNAVIETVHKKASSLKIDKIAEMEVRIYQLRDSLRPGDNFISKKQWQQAYQVVDEAYLDENASELSSNKALVTLEEHAQENIVAVLIVTASRDAMRVDTPFVSPLVSSRLKYLKVNLYQAPSSEAKIALFRKRQQHPDEMIYCGRPEEHVTPPSLLDETLCELRYNLAHIMPSAEDIQHFETLRQTVACIFKDEADRRNAFTDVMWRILPDEPYQGFIDEFHDDGDLRAPVLGWPKVLYYVQEVRVEVGASGSGDPYVEAIHYWLEHAITCTEGIESEVFNFPAILVMHFGPYLAIAAAALADRPIVEHLACIPLHAHSTNLAERASGERAVAALRVATHALLARYTDLASTKKTLATYPFRDFFEHGGDRHTFEYDAAVEDKKLFRAHRKDSGQKLYIKFSARYSEDAHRAACAIGFAPALHAVNRVGDWYMVVMEDVSEGFMTLFELKRPGFTGGPPLQGVQEAVTERLTQLHEKGYVHGDVRDVNVLVRCASLSGAPSTGDLDVMLVDWDWSGLVGGTTYPASINREDILRPTDAMGGTRITPEHDIWMSAHLSV